MKLTYLAFLSTIYFFLVACGNTNSEMPQKAVSTTQNETKEPKAEKDRKRIVFFGNSLTAAYRLNPSEGYVHLTQIRMDSLGLPYRTVNAGLSGETATAGNQRIDWVLRQTVDIFVLELGGNDALRGIDPEIAYQSLDSILTKVSTKYPQTKLVVAGMEAPPNLGNDYVKRFRNMYPRLAEKHHAALIPFFLDGVGGKPELNLSDGIHPNVEGQKVVLENVWKVLYPLLEPVES